MFAKNHEFSENGEASAQFQSIFEDRTIINNK